MRFRMHAAAHASEDVHTGRAKAPWHFWPVTIVAAIWNAFGAIDYAMSLIGGEAYYRQSGMNETLVAHYTDHPVLVFTPWTLGIVGAIAGSLLLAMKKREATAAFGLSFVGSALSITTTYLFADRAATEGGMMLVPALILVVCALLALYSRAMARRGVVA